MMKTVAVIVAAGNSSRFGANKLLESIDGVPVVVRAANAFLSHPEVDGVVIVRKAEDAATFSLLFAGENVTFADGGTTRTESVHNGLLAAKELSPFPKTAVLVHDGARPFVSGTLISSCINATLKHNSGVAALPVTDTLRKGDGETLFSPVSRDGLYAIQTPQAFWLCDLLEAYENATAPATDDSQLWSERFGNAHLVPGEASNRKITFLEDLPKETLFAGTGFDVHRLTKGRDLILCGVKIPFEKGLLGHSDADVATHAVMDALLSAASLPDIGHLFPDTDVRFEGADSILLLKEVVNLLLKHGFVPHNASLAIIAERPKLASFLPEMKEHLSAALSIPTSSVGISATTTEGLGIVGEGKGIAAQANVLIRKIN